MTMKFDSKYFDRIRIRPEGDRASEPREPKCQWDGCQLPGTHRAPVGRMKEGEYFCFCIDHVRQYNKSYNYFAGVADSDVARFQKEALTGHRPTWAMGTNGAMRASTGMSGMRSGTAGYYNRLNDPHGFVGSPGFSRTVPERRRKLRTLEARALETLGLPEAATGREIKSRYKALVKMHHPDANGGDRGSEDRFRDVVQAYRLLKQAGFC
jgi:curved DNA-binding protein CbpA